MRDVNPVLSGHGLSRWPGNTKRQPTIHNGDTSHRPVFFWGDRSRQPLRQPRPHPEVPRRLTSQTPRSRPSFLCLERLKSTISPSRHGGSSSMAFILIVAGTALALFVASLLVIERDERRDMSVGTKVN